MPNGPLDPGVWNVDVGTTIPGYNMEAETLTARPANVRVEGGNLILEARREQRPVDGRNYTSGHVNTQGKFSFQYGRLEVTLRAPQGVGTWPAAWLLAEGTKYNPADYGIDPQSDNAWALQGEIDFMEAVGAEPGRVFPDTHSYSTVQAGVNGTTYANVPDMATAFHTYGVEMTPGRIDFTLDGEVYSSAQRHSNDPRDWPFDQPYYLILNLAMGGSWGGEARDTYPPDGIQGNGPWQMNVQSVRFYDYQS